jgi:PPE-repeat protein
MMNFSVLPPEVNSWLMFSGAGSGPMLAAAAAWQGLATELDAAAQSFSSVTSGLAGQAWQGPASQAMAAAATPYAGWLNTAAAHASGAAAQAQAVVTAFESALAATVHPAAVAANRSDLVSLVMSNVFGQNATAIAAIESQYEQMWAQDVSAMVGYHGGASAAAAQLAVPLQALQNLPGMAANAAMNVGYGNIGNSNLGFFNNGIYNIGINNVGAIDWGANNTGFFNIGIGNINPNTTWNASNIGTLLNNPNLLTANTIGNIGVFNNGNDNFGGWNTGLANVGFGNTGTGNTGLGISYLRLLSGGNTGNFNQGFFNFGNYDLGIGNTGSNLIGFGLTGDHKIGIGPFYIAE